MFLHKLEVPAGQPKSSPSNPAFFPSPGPSPALGPSWAPMLSARPPPVTPAHLHQVKRPSWSLHQALPGFSEPLCNPPGSHSHSPSPGSRVPRHLSTAPTTLGPAGCQDRVYGLYTPASSPMPGTDLPSRDSQWGTERMSQAPRACLSALRCPSLDGLTLPALWCVWTGILCWPGRDSTGGQGTERTVEATPECSKENHRPFQKESLSL